MRYYTLDNPGKDCRGRVEEECFGCGISVNGLTFLREIYYRVAVSKISIAMMLAKL